MSLSSRVHSFVESLPDDAALRTWMQGGLMPHLLPHPALLPVWLLLSPVWAGYRIYRYAVHGDVGDELVLSSASPHDLAEAGHAQPAATAGVAAADAPPPLPLPSSSSDVPVNAGGGDTALLAVGLVDVVDNCAEAAPAVVEALLPLPAAPNGDHVDVQLD
jgi:hypothetical protein